MAIVEPSQPLTVHPATARSGTRWLLALGAAAGLVALAAACQLVSEPGQPCPTWPAAGIALLMGWRLGWPGRVAVLMAELAVAAGMQIGLLPALCLGLTLGLGHGIVGVVLERLRVSPDLVRVRDVAFLGLATLALALLRGASGSTFGYSGTFVGWAAADLAGMLWAGPLLILATAGRLRLGWESHCALIAATGLSGVVVGACWLVPTDSVVVGALASMPLALWVAWSGGPPPSALAWCLIGLGWSLLLPLGERGDLLPQQVMISIGSFTSLMAAAAFAERRQLIEALASSQALYRLAADQGQDLICLLDRDGRFRFASLAWHGLLGWDPQQLEQRAFDELLHDDERTQVLSRFDSAVDGLSHSDRQALVFRLRRREGDWLWCECLASAVHGPDGQPLVQAVCRDIGERLAADARRAEEARGDAHRERMAALGILAGGVAHEFNNLNAVILGNVEMLLRRSHSDERERRRLVQIREAVQRAAGITADLMDISRPAPGAAQSADLCRVVRTALDLTSATCQRRGIDLVSEVDDGPVWVRGHRGGLGQVLLNLLVNAVDAVEGVSGARIRITMQQDGDAVRLAVTDNGCGIAAAELPHIFLPFHSTKGARSGDGSRAGQSGAGLGLSVSETLIRQYQGRITVESTPGQGSTFTLVLQVTEPQQDSSSTRRFAAGHARRILVADDESNLRELTVERLTEHGYAVEAVADGPSAIERVSSGGYDLLILDWQMPGLDGGMVLARLATLRGKLPPVLLVSGWLDEAAVRPELRGLVCGILRKPYTGETLLRAIDDSLQGR